MASMRWRGFGAVLSLVCACSTQTSKSARPVQGALAGKTGGTSSPAAAGSGAGPAVSFANDAGVPPPPPVFVPTCPGPNCAEVDDRVPDDDGFSVADGDCDDFAVLVNPGAYDIPGNGVDEDCSGSDAPSEVCDEALALDDADPFAAARALELCVKTDESSRRWGVITARWTTPDGGGKPSSDLMHGLLPSFGKGFVPRAGKTVLALSSGVARAPGQRDHTADCSDAFRPVESDFPAGFDGSSATCSSDTQASSVGDAIALELRIRMPSNVTALSFDSAFFTEEYPDYICTPFNDYFQAIVSPARPGSGADGNVVFDLDGNAVSVNNSLLGACDPGEHGGKVFRCPLGVTPLEGTGYNDCEANTLLPAGLFGGLFGGGDKTAYGASTGWLNTEFAVTPGEIITLRLTIWDSDDSALDSLSLIDHVRFRLRSEPPPPEKPMTQPIVPG